MEVTTNLRIMLLFSWNHHLCNGYDSYPFEFYNILRNFNTIIVNVQAPASCNQYLF